MMLDTYCASFILVKDGETRLNGYSEHVFIDQKENSNGETMDMLHFAADSLDMSIGEICQVVADLGGIFEYDGWLDAYVPLKYVSHIAFEHNWYIKIDLLNLYDYVL